MILDKDVNQDTVHSPVVCKKCFKLFSEVSAEVETAFIFFIFVYYRLVTRLILQYDELEDRMADIRFEILTNYEKTIKKVLPNVQIQEEYNDHDYTEPTAGHTAESERYDDKESDGSSPIKSAENSGNMTEVPSFLLIFL